MVKVQESTISKKNLSQSSVSPPLASVQCTRLLPSKVELGDGR